MSAWQTLENALREALVSRPERLSVPAALTREIEALKQVLRGSGSAQPSRDLLQEAIRRFREAGELSNLSMARSVCYGSSIRFGQSEPPLIEGAIFRQLLLRIDEYLEEPRRYRRCYRGLLHTYFIYDGEKAPEIGQRNWTFLRTYLEQHRRAIRAEGVTPDWVNSIDDNANLLSNDPVSRYGPALLDGQTEVVDRFCSHLEIADASWLVRKLVLAQVEAATREVDHGFHRRVQPLLKVLSGYPLLEDAGLQLILNRYAQIESPPLHPELRDRAMECWGSPWLELRQVNWSRVSKEAQQLVATWIKLDLIREFFEALSEDRQTDKRRLQFWQQYHESIGDMYFALGPSVLSARGADIKRLRERMADHLLTLTDGGGAHNNAFIMMMGKYIVVEFGTKGNACFVFDAHDQPFVLKRTIAGDSTGLKHPAHKHRLLHMNSGDTQWEQKFRRVLSKCGLHPQHVSSHPNTNVGERQTSQVRASGVTRTEFLAFLNKNGVLWDDKTAKGGNLKVLHARFTDPIAEQLKEWGFAYSGRQFWYRREWP